MTVFAALAVIATISAQALAPALPGSATGIAGLINVTSFVAACTSQLVAAGGIALCLRALGGLWPWPNLGVAFRLVIFPVTLAVVALTITSAARPLDPELGRMVAVAAIVAGAASAPLLWSSSRTRSLGIVLFLAAGGGVFDLLAYEITRRSGALVERSGVLVAALGLSLDVAAAAWALAWAAVRSRRIPWTLGAVGLVAVVLAFSSRTGERHTASGALVVLHRCLEALSHRPLLALPPVLGQAFSLLPLLAAAALLVIPGRQPELRAALTLCLLGRTATGAPAAALLSVGAVLSALGVWIYGLTPRARPAHDAVNAESAPSTTTR
jgi:hypothetical protein